MISLLIFTPGYSDGLNIRLYEVTEIGSYAGSSEVSKYVNIVGSFDIISLVQ